MDQILKDNKFLLISKMNESNTETYFQQFLSGSKSFIYYIGNVLWSGFKMFFAVSKFYLCWIIIHFVASQLYIKWCTPYTFYGFIISPFLTLTPHCQGLRWVLYNGAGVINNMWFIFGSWMCANIFVLKQN
jgi:hypothetical protein